MESQKVEIAKTVFKERIPYIVPAKYSSTTFYRLFINDIEKGEYLASNYGGKKKLIELLKVKFKFDEYEIKDYGSFYR